jgi:hypothetical protein
MKITLVFLDFDGVMHPAGCDTSKHFCNLAHFEAVMREHPDAGIVIASTWRHAYPLSELKRHFSPDIGARIVGKTPALEDESDDHVRYEEIREFMRHPQLAGAQWVAVDDSDFEFPPGCANLVLCDSVHGFDAAAAKVLRERLAAAKDAP